MMLSVIIICGVDTTEQQIVEIAEDIKSKPGPIDSERFDREGTLSTKELSFCRTNSSMAKLIAPCGTDKTKFAPAPRLNVLNAFGEDNKVRTVGCATSAVLRDACRIVFIVFAGCMTVCATLRLIAPLIMLSQNTNGRCGKAFAAAVAVAAAVAPPLDVFRGWVVAEESVVSEDDALIMLELTVSTHELISRARSRKNRNGFLDNFPLYPAVPELLIS